MSELHKIKLIDLQELKYKLKNNYILPIATNYLLKVEASAGVHLSIHCTYSTFHKTHYLVCDHVRIINPNHQCWLEFTDTQLHELLIEEDYERLIKK